jgi:arylsulfatase A-like enzyme
VALTVLALGASAALPERPNIVLVMTDDQGWGETGYAGHPVLKTPNIDAMAANGLRFDRFYAASPVCSPTRASVFTGRAPDRCGVLSHGYALRKQERTLPAALKAAGYATGHFGKWHLDGFSGPGVPVLKDDPHNPGAFGFDVWLSISNFFDRDPLMSRMGVFEAFEGDSSGIIVREALAFIEKQAQAQRPFFAVIWDGSPHHPWIASQEDRAAFSGLDKESANHYGEIAAFDRAVGALRKGLRDLGVADNTLVWYNSDNGGLSNKGLSPLTPGTVGNLRGHKGDVWEGGIRVPCVIEWPAALKPRVTAYPAATFDIFPTLADILRLPENVLLAPRDGRSLVPLFTGTPATRPGPLPFRFQGRGAWVDNSYKLVSLGQNRCELYNLALDPSEATDIAAREPERFAEMKAAYQAWSASADASLAGRDYPEGRVAADHPAPQRKWPLMPEYAPYLEQFEKRPEYRTFIRQTQNKGKAKGTQ